MDKSDLTREWLSIAKKDLDSAEFLKDMKPEPVEIICYHCQQSAVKFLKAFLAYNQTEIIKTHDLLLLNSKCQIIDASFNQIDNECLHLTDFAVNIRYPYPLDLGIEDMKLAFKHAHNIKRFISEKIKDL